MIPISNTTKKGQPLTEEEKRRRAEQREARKQAKQERQQKEAEWEEMQIRQLKRIATGIVATPEQKLRALEMLKDFPDYVVAKVDF